MKKAIKIVVNVLAWALLLLALLITLVVFSSEKNNGVPNIMGYSPMTVESDSMKDTFKKGDLIIVKEIDDVGGLEEDDVITFWTIIEGQRVKNTHRIVKIEKNDDGSVKDFITRGDNNNGIDDDIPVSTGDVIGEWTGKKIVGAGKAMDFLRTKRGFFICIIIPMAIFFLFELYKFIVTLIDVRKGDEEEIDEEEIKRRAIEEYLAEQKKKEAGSAENIENKAEKAVEAAAETVEDKAEEAVEAAAETVEEKAEEAVEAAAETVEDKAEEAVEAAAETVEDKAEEAVEAAAETVEDNAEKAVEAAAETVEDKADEIVDGVQEK